jgi:hypothetical protein
MIKIGVFFDLILEVISVDKKWTRKLVNDSTSRLNSILLLGIGWEIMPINPVF